jgi:LPXTG-site transpeptidase (sortase) family protein
MNIWSRRTVFIVTIIGVVVLSIVFYQLKFAKSDINAIKVVELISTEQENPSNKIIELGLPVQLKIPNLKVDAVIEHVGLNDKGEMAVPTEATDVAWYQLGQRPGAVGSAVIAGHYGVKNDIVPVFDNLHQLKKGDKIQVTDDQRTVMNFTVTKIASYDKDADATEIFSSDDGKSHLNLITCEGTWNQATSSYPQRLVVFTELE